MTSQAPAVDFSPESVSAAGDLRWDLLFEQSPLSIQVFAPDGRTIRFNPAWEKLFGLSREDAYAFNVLEVPDLIESGAIHEIRKAFDGEVVFVPPVPFPVKGRPQEIRWIGGTLYPVITSDGVLQEVVVIHHDITELLSRYDGRLNPLQRSQYTSSIMGAVKRMTGMMEHILLLARIDSGNVALALNPIDLTIWLPKTLAEIKGTCPSQDICPNHSPADSRPLENREENCPIEHEIHLEIDPSDMLRHALLDEALLHHIVGNLFSNACKYSPPASPIDITLRHQAPDLILSIRNQGPGITLARQHDPRLILCDVMMPGIDGYTVLATLRADPALSSIPFIFLTENGGKTPRTHLRETRR